MDVCPRRGRRRTACNHQNANEGEENPQFVVAWWGMESPFTPAKMTSWKERGQKSLLTSSQCDSLRMVREQLGKRRRTRMAQTLKKYQKNLGATVSWGTESC